MWIVFLIEFSFNLQVQAESRGDLRPDPLFDAINIIVMVIQNDISSSVDIQVLLRGAASECRRYHYYYAIIINRFLIPLCCFMSWINYGPFQIINSASTSLGTLFVFHVVSLFIVNWNIESMVQWTSFPWSISGCTTGIQGYVISFCWLFLLRSYASNWVLWNLRLKNVPSSAKLWFLTFCTSSILVSCFGS